MDDPKHKDGPSTVTVSTDHPTMEYKPDEYLEESREVEVLDDEDSEGSAAKHKDKDEVSEDEGVGRTEGAMDPTQETKVVKEELYV